MNEFKIDDIQFEILNFLLQNGEVRFTKLIENLSKSENFKHYGVESLKVILLRKIKPLVEKGYIQKKDLGHQNVHYLIPHEKLQTVKIMLEREALKKNFNEKLSSTNTLDDIEFYKKKLIELERERQKNKLLERIRWFESLKVLPSRVVRQKLEKMGFKKEDFFTDKGVELINTGMDPWLNSHFKPEDIEIKIIRVRKITRPELEKFVRLQRDGKTRVTLSLKRFAIDCQAVQFFLGPGWIVLNSDAIKGHRAIEECVDENFEVCVIIGSDGYQIIGAYKELLQLYKEYANLQLLEIKEAWQLSDEDIKALEPALKELAIKRISNPLMAAEINNCIINYLINTGKDTLERVKRFYIKFGLNEKDAEQCAQKLIEQAKNAKTEK